MTNELGTAVLKLKTDDSEFNKGVDRAHDKAGILGLSLNRVGEIAGGMLTRDVIREGFSRFQELMGSTIEAASDQAKVQAQLAAAIKSTGGAAGESLSELNDQAEAFQKTTTFGHTAVGAVQALLLTFTDLKANILPDATQTVLDMSTALGEDTKEAAIQLGKALNDPILGVTALRRVGVQLSDQQQQQIKDFVAVGDKARAQQVIMAELNKEFGGSAAAQVDTYAGKMAQLGNKITDVKEEIGFTLQGGIMTLMEYLQAHQDDIGAFFDKWRDRLSPVVNFVETRIGGIIQTFKGVYGVVSDVVDGIDSVIHGDWKSVWQDAKDIPEQLLKIFLGNIADEFGTLPNIMISAVQAGVNGIIDLLNKIPKIKTPGFSTPFGDVGSQTIFGGFDIGHVDLPQFNLPKFDFGDAFSTLSDAQKELAEKAKAAKPPVVALGSAYEDSGDAAAKAGKTIQEQLADALGKIRGMSSSLFALPTREMATLQLKADQLQQKADQVQVQLQPSIDALTALKQGILDSAEAAKEALQAQKDSIDSAKELISAVQDQLTDRSNQLDQIHSQMQDAIKARFEPPKKLTPEEAALARDTSQFNQAKRQVEDQQKALDRQTKALDANAKQLDKASKAVDDNSSKETKLIDKRIAGYQKEIDTANKQVQLVQAQIKLHEDERKIMQDILTLADRTLLTEKEQQSAFEIVKKRIGDLSQGVLDMVGGVKTKLIPGFNDLVAARGPLDLLEEKATSASQALGRIAANYKGGSGDMWKDVVTNLNSQITKLFASNPNAHYVNSIKPPDVGEAGLASHATGGFFATPTVGIIGDSPGGEWLFNQGQLRSLIREIQRPPDMGSSDITIHLPNATIYASTPEEAQRSISSLGLAIQMTSSSKRKGGMR